MVCSGRGADEMGAGGIGVGGISENGGAVVEMVVGAILWNLRREF